MCSLTDCSTLGELVSLEPNGCCYHQAQEVRAERLAKEASSHPGTRAG